MSPRTPRSSTRSAAADTDPRPDAGPPETDRQTLAAPGRRYADEAREGDRPSLSFFPPKHRQVRASSASTAGVVGVRGSRPLPIESP
nr:hypothetical protein [Human alphaherpesvirus 1]